MPENHNYFQKVMLHVAYMGNISPHYTKIVLKLNIQRLHNHSKKRIFLPDLCILTTDGLDGGFVYFVNNIFNVFK